MATIEDVIEAAESFRLDLRALRKDADLTPSYKNFVRYLTQYWRMQSQDFMKVFDGIFTEASASRTRIDRAWNTAASRANAKLIRQTKTELAENIRTGAASSLTDIPGASYGVGFDKKDTRITRYINQRATTLAKELTATSQQRLTGLIDRLANEGATKAQIGKAVRSEIRGWHTAPSGVMSRAELVGITETGEAYEFGRDMVTDDLEKIGVLLEKRWILVADSYTCTVCEAAIGDDWIHIKSLFSNGYSRPLAHPACRCDVELRDVTPGGTTKTTIGAQEFEKEGKARSWAQKNWRGQPKNFRQYPSHIAETLDEYTTDTYFDINKALRFDNKSLLKFHAEDIRNLDDAVQLGAPLPDDAVMWRGLQYKPKDLMKLSKDPTRWVGKTFTDKGFGSMSLSKDVASTFAEPSKFIFKVETSKGTRMITGYNGQVEYLMPRGTRYRVKLVEQIDAPEHVLGKFAGRRSTEKWWQITLELFPK